MTKKTSAFLRFVAQPRKVFVTQDKEVFTFSFSFLLNPNPRPGKIEKKIESEILSFLLEIQKCCS